jgi:hypothetical protein
MLLEDQRFIHEDLERLEQGIADRVAEEPRNVSLPPSRRSQSYVPLTRLFIHRFGSDSHATIKSLDF